MSKMDGLRAMREANYAAAQKRAAGVPAKSNAKTKAKTKAGAARAPVAPPAEAPAKAAGDAVGEAAAAAVADSEELCGHRNMSGRTCTREQGHAAKSHRYS